MTGSPLRVFVALWVALGVAGALNHTIALDLFGRRADLVLPHLKYGFVMFNLNSREASVYEYAGADGARHDLADLVATPAPGYPRARLAIDSATHPDYVREVCFRAFRASGSAMTFYRTDYQVDVGLHREVNAYALRCDGHGLAPL